MKEPTSCPECCSEDIGDRWCNGRMLQYYCRECGWHAEPRTPEKIPITNTCELRVDDFSGWHYIIYDKYGHVQTDSATYDTREEALKELEDDLTPKPGYVDPSAPLTAVLFNVPDHVTIKGTMFKLQDGKVKKI